MRSFLALALSLLGCDPNNNTSSTETDGLSTTTSPTSSTSGTETATEGMSSTSSPTSTSAPTTTTSPTTTTGEEPQVTICHEVLGGFGVEPPEDLVGQVCKTCSGDDCGCLWGVELAGQCVLDCEDATCPKGLTCLHLAWDGQDAWGCWPHPGGGADTDSEADPDPSPEPEPTCRPILDLQGTVIGEVCPSAGCPLGVEPLTGLCLQPCELGCLKGQACQELVIDQEVVSVCWTSET